MIKAFEDFYDFTNWDVIFQVFDAFRGNVELVYDLYTIIDVRLIAMHTEDHDDVRLQLFEHYAIEFLARAQQIGNEMLNICVVKLIHRFDGDLDNIDKVRHFPTLCYVFSNFHKKLLAFSSTTKIVFLLTPLGSQPHVCQCY